MNKETIGIIGLGYVGLPLACLFASRYRVVGFDLNARRVDEINGGVDATREISGDKLRGALQNGLVCTTDEKKLQDCNIYIVAVPTPVDQYTCPQLDFLEAASQTVGRHIAPGNVVVYESTVYPGATEEFCVPIIEKVSGLKYNADFFVGYSPERINPGDREHTIENICKITSGSTPEAAKRIDDLYRSVLSGGTYPVSSIRIAEAAKVIENSQRDVNIAFMNEISKILNVLDIDVAEVLKAAGTKWNFLPFHPGLVGGHCISIDPYYLIQRAELYGIRPQLMIEARHINNMMGYYVADSVIRYMNLHDTPIRNAHILLLGFAFKENCSDIRNTRVVDIYRSFCNYTPHVRIYDPYINAEDARREYGVEVDTSPEVFADERFDAVVCCIEHSCFRKFDTKSLCKPGGGVYSVNGCMNFNQYSE